MPILKTPDEMAEDTQRIMAGDEPLPSDESANTVEGLPDGFQKWTQENAGRIADAYDSGKPPYFLKDNFGSAAEVADLGRWRVADEEERRIAVEDEIQSCGNSLTPEQKTRKLQIKNELTQIKDKTYSSDLFNAPLTLPNKSVREWLNQPFKEYDLKNELLLSLQDHLNNCKSMFEFKPN